MTSYRAVQKIKNIKYLGIQKIYKLYVLGCTSFGLRPRYLFTRENKLRLRYLAYIWLAVFAVSLVDQDRTSNAHTSTSIQDDITIAALDPSFHITPQLGQKYDSEDGSAVARIKDNNGDTANVVTAATYIEHNSTKTLAGGDDGRDLVLLQNTFFIQRNGQSREIAFKEFDWAGAINAIDMENYLKSAKPNTSEKHENSEKIVNVAGESPDLSSHQNDNIHLASASRTQNLRSVDNSGYTSGRHFNKFTAGYHPIPPRPTFQEQRIAGSKQFEVRHGDTLAGILNKAGLDARTSQKVIIAMKSKYDPRYLKVGQKIDVEFRKNRLGRVELAKLSMPLSGLNTLSVSHRGFDEFDTQIEKMVLKPQLRAKNIVIKNSLYGSASQQGLPMDVADKVLRIYAWDIDFQRDLHKGDKLEVLYEELLDSNGNVVAYGDLKYANLTVKGSPLPVYQFETDEGRVDYFEPNGHSVRKALMRTPIDGARISSGYGMRHHPILGYSKMHKGVDFAAPIGTPIFAAGDGVVEKKGRYGAYGKYIRIRHNNRLKTAYAHLHNYKSGIQVGDRVEQGDVIGYLGNTGRSTGPHLHYEVIVNNKQVNPGSLDLPTGTILTGIELNKFKRQMNRHRENYALHLDESKLAFATAASR